MSNPPIISIYGASNSGKTELVEYLLEKLTSQDYRVATIKHSRGEPDLDRSGTDSWRHFTSGAETVVISSPNKTISLSRGERPLAQIQKFLDQLGEWDLILAEGFKEEDIPKIAVGDEMTRSKTIYRYEDNREEVLNVVKEEKNLQEIVSHLEGLDCGSCGYDSCRDLAKAILSGDRTIDDCRKIPERRVQLVVNGTTVQLSKFPADLIAQTLGGLAKALKGVEGEVESLELEIENNIH